MVAVLGVLVLSGFSLLLFREDRETVGAAKAPGSSSETAASLDGSPAMPASERSMVTNTNATAVPQTKDGATLTVFLTDGSNAVAGGLVELLTETGQTLATSEASGPQAAAPFQQLSAGRYALRVKQAPAGYLVPRPQAASRERIAATTTISNGSTSVELKLDRSCLVFGSVRGPLGENVEQSFVRFSSFEKLGRFVPESEFGITNGFYQGELYEGMWIGEVIAGVSNADWKPGALTVDTHPLARRVPPWPDTFQVLPGESRQIDFAFEAGQATLGGKINDETGGPFGGLQVYAYRVGSKDTPELGRAFDLSQPVGRSLTDSNGNFSFPELPLGDYVVNVEPDGFFPLAEPGKSKVGVLCAPLKVAVHSSAPALLQVTVPRPHPCRVMGRVTRTPQTATGDFPPTQLVLGIQPWRQVERRSVVELSSEGTFYFFLEASESDAWLEFRTRDGIVTYPLVLSASSDLPLLNISLP